MNSTHRTEINIPYPDASLRHLQITVGACRLKIAPSDGTAWVMGTYDDPTGGMPCRITQDGGSVRITQEPHLAEMRGRPGAPPVFDLALGTAQPYILTVETGASDNDFELGGLPINRLAVKLGAGKNVMRFSAPNPQAMSLLDLDAGAGSMEIGGLANANFAELTIDGGAASFTCDFSGTLQRDAYAKISTGLSSVEIVVHGSSAVRFTSESFLGHLDVSEGFSKQGGEYWTRAAVGGVTPVLTIHAAVALGSVRLQAN